MFQPFKTFTCERAPPLLVSLSMDKINHINLTKNGGSYETLFIRGDDISNNYVAG